MPAVRARKRFGQHFLHDAGVIRRIVAAAAPQPGQAVLEIGPGRGAITRGLIEAGASLTVVEIDRDLAATLATEFGQHLNLITGDVLDLDLAALPQPIRVVGNLPYNISTPVLFHLFAQIDRIDTMLFMLQKEVADRLAAPHGNKTYGRLSVTAQLRCDVRSLFNVPPGAFAPPPAVMSSVVYLAPRADRPAQPIFDALDTVLVRAFGKRRKTLSNALADCLDGSDFETLGINPRLRPENLTPDDFLRCAIRFLEKEGCT